MTPVNSSPRDWDRVLTYAFFICYGFFSIFHPIISVDRVSDHWAEVTLGVLFIYAGSSMLYGLFTDHYAVWRMGMAIAFIGLTTISGLIATVGGFAVLAYAFLFAAFAMQCLYGIRREKRRRESEQLRRQLESIIASVRPEGMR